MEHFFRLGDVVRVKSLDYLKSRGVTVFEETDDSGSKISYCVFRGIVYSIFEDFEHSLPGNVGVVSGGIYDKYLEVKVNNSIWRLPYFVLEPYDEIDDIIALEENVN